MIDYSLLARRDVPPAEVMHLNYDLFISSFNSSDRVGYTYRNVQAARKIWIIHPEYQYRDEDLPKNAEFFRPTEKLSVAEFWLRFLSEAALTQVDPALRIAVDITGMMRPHLMLLPLILKHAGVRYVDFLYSDPASYVAGNSTEFARGEVSHVAQIEGFEGLHFSPSERDVLVIGAGYDKVLVQLVADHKRACRHYVLLGLPSLQPHMYQESQLQVARTEEWLNSLGEDSFLFSPANNPFMTAQVLGDHLSREDSSRTNIYLSPVGSKSQALGFAWYYLCEARETATSMLFPFAPFYSRETSSGITRLGIFTLELDWIQDI